MVSVRDGLLEAKGRILVMKGLVEMHEIDVEAGVKYLCQVLVSGTKLRVLKYLCQVLVSGTKLRGVNIPS